MNRSFNRFARVCADVMGSHWSFIVATALCALWAATGPMFDYSDTWQLVINTAG
jgi:low affinity Fe/Cu permease